MKDRHLPRTDDPELTEPPGLEFVCAVGFSVSDISDVRTLAPGRRITLQVEPGSQIDGPRLRGHFLPGSTFVQMGRADNVVEVEGRAVIETHDGHHIVARSLGVLSMPLDAAAALAEGERYTPSLLYARGAMLFEAAEGSPYTWLNRGLHVFRTHWTGADAFTALWRVL